MATWVLQASQVKQGLNTLQCSVLNQQSTNNTTLPCSLVNVLVQRCLLSSAALVSMGSVVIVQTLLLVIFLCDHTHVETCKSLCEAKFVGLNQLEPASPSKEVDEYVLCHLSSGRSRIESPLFYNSLVFGVVLPLPKALRCTAMV